MTLNKRCLLQIQTLDIWENIPQRLGRQCRPHWLGCLLQSLLLGMSYAEEGMPRGLISILPFLKVFGNDCFNGIIRIRRLLVSKCGEHYVNKRGQVAFVVHMSRCGCHARTNFAYYSPPCYANWHTSVCILFFVNNKKVTRTHRGISTLVSDRVLMPTWLQKTIQRISKTTIEPMLTGYEEISRIRGNYPKSLSPVVP